IEQGSTANYLIPDASSRIELLAKNFLGNIEQVPPRVSAVKLDGKRSYERARAGEAFELSSRPATIYELELNFLSEELLSYRVQCSRGTYVRSLARDFGRVLGVPATLESIRRITSGPFHISQATSLDELIDPTLCDEIALLPVELLLSDLPRVTVPTEVLFRLSQGNQADLRSSQELGLPSEGNV